MHLSLGETVLNVRGSERCVKVSFQARGRLSTQFIFPLGHKGARLAVDGRCLFQNGLYQAGFVLTEYVSRTQGLKQSKIASFPSSFWYHQPFLALETKTKGGEWKSETLWAFLKGARYVPTNKKGRIARSTKPSQQLLKALLLVPLSFYIFTTATQAVQK